MENWEWPQYVIAVWFIWTAFLGLGASIAINEVRQWGFLLGRLITFSILAWILYMGSFWS